MRGQLHQELPKELQVEGREHMNDMSIARSCLWKSRPESSDPSTSSCPRGYPRAEDGEVLCARAIFHLSRQRAWMHGATYRAAVEPTP